MRVCLHCGDGVQNAQLYIEQNDADEPVFEIVGLPLQSNAKPQEKMVEAFCGPNAENADGRLDFTLGYVHVLSQTTMLRSAYLAMFRHFGYSYILHPALNAVRDQIWQPITGTGEDAFVTHPHLLRPIAQSDGAAKFDSTQVAWLQSPGQGFCVLPSFPSIYLTVTSFQCPRHTRLARFSFIGWDRSHPVKNPSRPRKRRNFNFRFSISVPTYLLPLRSVILSDDYNFGFYI